MMSKNIYIVGAGAIGKALAVFLKLNNKNVTLIRGSKDNEACYTEKIYITLPDNTELEANIEINTLSNVKKLDGIIVLTNKSFGNQDLSNLLKEKVNGSPLVILQNGLGVEQPFIDNGFSEVYRCVLFATSQVISKSKLRFKPVSVSPIGVIKGSHDTLNSVVDQLSNVYFLFKYEQNIQTLIWKKAIANSVFNSICPLLEVDNGIFHRNERVMSIAKRIIQECISISKEIGITLNTNEVEDSLLFISKSSDGQLISTLQDINNKRETEIETLNFEIVRIATKLGKQNLVKETKLLGELVKLKSDLSRKI